MGVGTASDFNALVEKLDKNKMLWGAVSFCLLGAIMCGLWLGNWTKAMWLPSLACNLLTTGIAIFVINVVVADLEKKERERRESLRRQRSELRKR